jgi:hypothetical protein
VVDGPAGFHSRARVGYAWRSDSGRAEAVAGLASPELEASLLRSWVHDSVHRATKRVFRKSDPSSSVQWAQFGLTRFERSGRSYSPRGPHPAQEPMRLNLGRLMEGLAFRFTDDVLDRPGHSNLCPCPAERPCGACSYWCLTVGQFLESWEPLVGSGLEASLRQAMADGDLSHLDDRFSLGLGVPHGWSAVFESAHRLGDPPTGSDPYLVSWTDFSRLVAHAPSQRLEPQPSDP